MIYIWLDIYLNTAYTVFNNCAELRVAFRSINYSIFVHEILSMVLILLINQKKYYYVFIFFMLHWTEDSYLFPIDKNKIWYFQRWICIFSRQSFKIWRYHSRRWNEVFFNWHNSFILHLYNINRKCFHHGYIKIEIIIIC